MKKILLGVMFFMLLFSLDKTTYAKNVYYINKNGVVFSNEEYIFLNKM